MDKMGGVCMRNKVRDFIENKSSIDMSRLGDLSKLKEEDMILEK